MKQVLIIPDRAHLKECLELKKRHNLGFEYNDFFIPDILDDENQLRDILVEYKREELPQYCTIHGAFFDVIPFSPDKRIREIADLRIQQSLDVARRIGAKAVVFHTNYDPFLNTESYIRSWIDINEKYWSRVLEGNMDINIYLENMFDTTPDIMSELSERLCKHKNYGVCFDFAHASLSKVQPEIWAQKLGRYVKHIHINDNDGISDLHLAWGDGVLDRSKFYESYDKYMKGASILIETSSMENKIRSLEVLKKEGFLEN
ncbi:MAG: sugar phosphate isomerase/epimerase [Agathobacter sp.]|nr:sugar phosphate isomerase/epimerase [Agathobacter sp.]